MSVVYFLKPEAKKGPIKIGVTREFKKRMVAYRGCSPVALEVLVTAPGSYKHERALHEAFAYARSHLEWFHPVEDLLAGIRALKAGVSLEEAFNLSHAAPSPMPQHREALERAVQIFKSQAALAQAAGLTQQGVSYLLKAPTISAEVAVAIERATSGQVRREELRPDIFES